ncbi:hypothetical protein ACI3L1_06630 [Deinococcus sp. SM5_A1]|uniref:hypothetical protein n=1 Tax=Deinococcus sp. SM5_A1 TaxID=3379094 RepID=UPI00385AFE71
MTRTDAVLAIICAGPERTWTPAQVSEALGWPPEKAAALMRHQFASGYLLPSGPGRYHLPTHIPAAPAPHCRPSRAGLTPPRTLPPLAPPAHAPNPADLVMVMNALHAHGRPMSETLLLHRLNRPGLELANLQELLAALESGGQTRRTPERLHELTVVGL